MPLNQKIFALVLGVFFFLAVLDLIRLRKIKMEYALLWLITSSVVLVFVIWYDALVWLTDLIGAVLPTTTLFIFGIFFLLLMNLHFSVKLSEFSERIKNLSQETAILRAALEETTKSDEPPASHS